jgi:predicted N-acetyltransferase YhbS
VSEHPDFDVRAITPSDGAALAALFERERVACHCRYWHFSGSTNEWLDRCANHAGESRTELLGAVQSASPEMSGVIAESDGTIVGWLKLAPATTLGKLYGQRLYRGLPCFDGERTGVLTVGCLLVATEWRRRGVSRALVAGAVREAARRGARAVEAFPRRADSVSDAELFMGIFGAFVEEGFEVVSDFAPYPVLRRGIP